MFRLARLMLATLTMMALVVEFALPKTALAQDAYCSGFANQVSYNPTSGPPGTTVTVVGANWTPNEMVGLQYPPNGALSGGAISVTSPSGSHLAQVAEQADPRGGFSFTFTVPSNATPGPLETYIYTETPCWVTVAGSRFFTVTAAPPPPTPAPPPSQPQQNQPHNPQAYFNPPSGPPNTLVQVTGTGWVPDDASLYYDVAILWPCPCQWPTAPGEDFWVADVGDVDAQGTLTGAIEIPDNAPPGPVILMLCHQSRSPTPNGCGGNPIYVTFTVTASPAPAPTPVQSQPQPAPPAPGPCQFVLGFKTLHDLIPDTVGDCTDNQSFDSDGNAIQHTVANGQKGLLVWRKLDNWTAFTDGYHTWINGKYGLQERLNSDRFLFEGDLAPPAATGASGAASAPPVPAPVPTPTPPLGGVPPGVFPLLLEIADKLDTTAGTVCQYADCGRFGKVLGKVDKMRDDLTILTAFGQWLDRKATNEDMARELLDHYGVPKSTQDAIIPIIPAVHDTFLAQAGGDLPGLPEVSSMQVFSTLGDVHVVIDGSGFRASPPPLESPSFNGSGVVSRAFIIIDQTAKGWAAGNSSPAPGCAADGIGVIVRKWSDSEIVLGFGSNYADPYIFSPGDTVEFDLSLPGQQLTVSKGGDCEGNVVDAGTAGWAQATVQP